MNWHMIRPLVTASIAAVLLLGVPGSGLVVPLSAQGLEYLPGPIIEDPPGPYTGQSYVGPPENFVRQTGRVPLGVQRDVQRVHAAGSGRVSGGGGHLGVADSVERSNSRHRQLDDARRRRPGFRGPEVGVPRFPRRPEYQHLLRRRDSQEDQRYGSHGRAVGHRDIVANFNSSFEWYLGTDGNAGTSYDLMTVVLHELAHGLGFIGSMPCRAASDRGDCPDPR